MALSPFAFCTDSTLHLYMEKYGHASDSFLSISISLSGKQSCAL